MAWSIDPFTGLPVRIPSAPVPVYYLNTLELTEDFTLTINDDSIVYIFIRLKRKEFKTTDTELAAIAPPATKTAGANDASFEKFAAENPDLVKEAADLGFATTMGQLEKLAEAAYAQGWNSTVQQIHKSACDCFVAGFKDTQALIENAR